jgi:hypothetical protein
VKTALPIAHCQPPSGELPAPAASSALAPRAPRSTFHVSRFTFHVPRSALHAFTLTEILISIALLSFIVLGLFAMFNQTQRAFRASMTQSDILEAGRAVAGMIPRELEQAAPSYRNAVNFSAAMIPNSTPLTQLLPGAIPPSPPQQRTNFLEDCFLLLRQNQTWIGIGYCVRTNDASGRLWLPEVLSGSGQLGAGTLYRYTTSTNVLMTNGVAADPGQLYALFKTAAQAGSAAISNRICDGVVHFRLRAFATNGFPLFSDGLHTNACFRTNSLTVGHSLVSQTFTTPNLGYPDNWSGLYFWSNAVPATIELELGLLEQYAWDRYNSIVNPSARLAYLQRDDTSSRVHLFRQRIPIPNVDPSAYQ